MPPVCIASFNTSDVHATKSLALSILPSLSYIFNVTDYKYNLIDTSYCKILMCIKFSNHKYSVLLVTSIFVTEEAMQYVLRAVQEANK